MNESECPGGITAVLMRCARTIRVSPTYQTRMRFGEGQYRARGVLRRVVYKGLGASVARMYSGSWSEWPRARSGRFRS